MKCATCNASTFYPIHSARPNPALDSVDNYHICPYCGHEVLVYTYEGIFGRFEMSRHKSVKIGQKDSVGMDEWWCNWWGCPECGVDHVAMGFNYCPNCGIKLEWEEEK